MNIRNRRELKRFAAGRLENARDIRKIIMLYAAVTLGLTALVTAVNYVLGIRIDSLSGLSSFRTKSVLSTIQSVSPMALSLVTMCLEIGYLAVMLRIARGQYVSEQTLRLGFDRFWQLLRVSIFKGLRYAILLFLSIYAGIMIYMMTPLSAPAMEVLTPYMSQMSALSGELVLDDAAYAAFAEAVWPAYVICGVIFAVAAVPTWYSYRMTNYLVIDKPGMGALEILRQSKQMMRGHRVELLKLDVSLWWYYLLLFGAQAVCYGDVILPMLGITMPGNADIWYLLFMAVYLVCLLVIYCTVRTKVEVSYALAYDSIKPEEKQPDGVVLGNIFQM